MPRDELPLSLEPVWFSPESLLGRVIGQRYQLRAVIGSGGSGVLFAATDLQANSQVAVKLHRWQRPGSVDAASRFTQEGDVGARLGQHPNIVKLLDWGRHEGQFPFLVFELLEGETLEAERLSSAPMDPARVLSVLLPIMGAMAFAHDRGVLHRDLKPQNIFLARDGLHGLTPKLLDFGIAKRSDGLSLTRSGAIVGTPAFMSPEQALDEPLDARTDVWSMGVVLFACLTGELPFGGDSHTRMLLEVVSTPAPSLAAIRDRLPPNLCAAIEKALERSRLRRYGDMREFARALKEAAAIDGIALPTNPDPIGLAEWATWTLPERVAPADYEIMSREGGAIARYRDCLIGIQRGPGGDAFMARAFDHSRQVQAMFGRYAMMIIVDAASEPLGKAELVEVLRFYDQAPLTCAAQVVRAEGAIGVVHRAVMSTINFVTRRPYPIKVFANSTDGARWLAQQQVPADEVETYTNGFLTALERLEDQMVPAALVPPPRHK